MMDKSKSCSDFDATFSESSFKSIDSAVVKVINLNTRDIRNFSSEEDEIGSPEPDFKNENPLVTLRRRASIRPTSKKDDLFKDIDKETKEI